MVIRSDFVDDFEGCPIWTQAVAELRKPVMTEAEALATCLKAERRIALTDAAQECLKYLDEYVGPDRQRLEVVLTQVANRINRLKDPR